MASLLELMLDCFILYQILPPKNLRVCAKRRIPCPVKFSTNGYTYTMLSSSQDTTSHVCPLFLLQKRVERGFAPLTICNLSSAFPQLSAATPLRSSSGATRTLSLRSDYVPSYFVVIPYPTSLNLPLCQGLGLSTFPSIYLADPRDSFLPPLDPTLNSLYSVVLMQ